MRRRRDLLRTTSSAWGLVAASMVFLLGSLLFLVQSTEEAAPNDAVRRTVELSLASGEPLRITYLGDSLTAGLYATTEQGTFRYLTTTALADGGRYSEQGTNIVGGTVEATLEGNDQLPQGQHLYIIELGTNDMNEVDYRPFGRQYETLLGRVREASPEAGLVCLGTWRPASRGATYDLVIRQLCESHGGAYRAMSDLAEQPMYKGPADRETFQGPSDDFHPNDAGHAAIFERVVSAIEVPRQG